MRYHKFFIIFVLLITFSGALISQTLSPQQVIMQWNKAEYRSKRLYNIALYQRDLRVYWNTECTMRDSVIVGLSEAGDEYKNIIELTEQKVINLQKINENLNEQLKNSNKGLSKSWYFGIGLTVGVVPPCLAIILLGGK